MSEHSFNAMNTSASLCHVFVDDQGLFYFYLISTISLLAPTSRKKHRASSGILPQSMTVGLAALVFYRAHGRDVKNSDAARLFGSQRHRIHAKATQGVEFSSSFRNWNEWAISRNRKCEQSCASLGDPVASSSIYVKNIYTLLLDVPQSSSGIRVNVERAIIVLSSGANVRVTWHIYSASSEHSTSAFGTIGDRRYHFALEWRRRLKPNISNNDYIPNKCEWS